MLNANIFYQKYNKSISNYSRDIYLESYGDEDGGLLLVKKIENLDLEKKTWKRGKKKRRKKRKKKT